MIPTIEHTLASNKRAKGRTVSSGKDSDVGGNGHKQKPSVYKGQLTASTLTALQRLSNIKAQSYAAQSKLALERLQWGADNFAGIFGGHRNFYSALGWITKLKFDHYIELYERGGVLGTPVDIYVEDTWAEPPTIEDVGEADQQSQFELAVIELFDELNVWGELERADRLAGIGGYSVIYLATGDSDLTSELGPTDIVKLCPLSRERAVPLDDKVILTQLTRDRLGLPEAYTVTFSKSVVRPVHHSRIVHIAECLLDDPVNGTPRLKRTFNDATDYRKVLGSGAESAWFNSMMRILLDYSGDTAGDVTTEDIERLIIEDANQQGDEDDEIVELINGLRPIAETDAKPHVIRAQAINFATNLMAQLKVYAAAHRIPWGRFLGSELGLRSSSNEKKTWDDRIDRRRSRICQPWERDLTDRFIVTGQLPQPQGGTYRIVQPRREEMTETEKNEAAKTRAETNKANTEAGLGPVYSTEEIRVDIHDKTQPAPEIESTEPVVQSSLSIAAQEELDLGSELASDHIDTIAAEIVEMWFNLGKDLDIDNLLADGEESQAIVHDFYLNTLPDLLEEAFADAGDRHAELVTSRGTWEGNISAVTATFNPTSSEAVAWLESNIDDYINNPDYGVGPSTYNGLRQAALDAAGRGLSSANIAKHVRPFVGLDYDRIDAVANLRIRMTEANLGTLIRYGKRKLRTPKGGWTQAKIDLHASRYISKLLNDRARAFGRDLVARANNGAQRELWRQGVEAGSLNPAEVKRRFLKNTERHAEFDGEEVDINEPFTYEPGSAPNCGCGQTLVRV